MSKNLTRKGLALGAVVALGSTLFAGTPASAATAISLDTAFGTSGTTQNGVLGEYFTLASSLTGGTSGDKLKFKVEGATAANLVATSRSTVSLTATGAAGSYTAASVAAVDTYAASTIPVVDNNAKVAAVIPVAYVAGQYTQVAFGLGAAVTDTTTLKITPFIDNGVTDNLITAGELTGTPVSITFHKPSTITATPTLSSITTGSAVTAVVALNNGINVEQLRLQANGAPVDASKIGVKFLYNGVAQAETAVRWNTTDKAFQATAENAVTGKIYGATGVVDGTDSVSAGSGTSSSATNITATSALSVSGAQYRATDSAAPGTTTQVVRAGAGTITAEFDVTTVAATKLKSGQKVSFTVVEDGVDSLDAGASVTAGGKTLTNSSTLTRQSITVDVTTDKDGNAALPISYTGLKNNNTLRVFGSYIASGGALTTVPASSTVASGGFLLTGEDSLAVKLVNEDKSGNAAAVSRVAKGGTLSLPFVLVDQFGMTPVGTYRATVTNAGNASITSPIALVDGKMSVSVKDNSTADNNAGYAVTAQIQKLGTNGVTYTDVSGVTESHTVSVGAVTTGSTITLGALGSATPAAASATLKPGNFDILQNKTIQVGTTTIASGSVVTGPTGAAVAGAKVTFSAKGVLFISNNVAGLDSLTVTANENGVLPAIGIMTNTVGKTTITATSGSGSATATITVAAVATGGYSWTITAPTSILPGQTLKVTGVLKDAYGSLVNTLDADSISVVYTGPGYVTTTIAKGTDADGAVSFSVLLGAADSGTATVKFTYGGADLIAADTVVDDVVATASIIIGAAPVTAPAATAAVSGSTGKFYVSATNAAAKKVVVKVAGKFFSSFTGTAAKKTVALKAPKGKHKVTVFVGGKLVTTKTITVK
ncbi:beta strand repeat-containing protein [Rhodoluna lacicola]|uniref:Uncharacterized protein n=1 Tax=Rhodoluna lacicola TaxID=529884 RepID=A0A060JPF5_9MICO|nr:hypothetical protein [Rhodoluna lacicola]AIC48064.1 hypothetical protein Rhola_00012720 [Rhodoluna lacicola]